MKSSLKNLVSLMLVVVMIITTNNFNSFSLTLDTLVRNEIEINKERNKNNNTKYYEEFLSEKKQYLLNDEGNASKATTKNNDIDKTVKDYLVDGNMDNINKDIKSYIGNNKSSNDNDNGNQVNDADENEKTTFNDDNAINNKINDAANKSINNDENKNDVQVDVVEDVIIEDDIDSVVSDAIAVNDTSNLNSNDGELKSDIEQLEISISTDSDMDIYSEAQVFGIDGEPKVGDTVKFGVYEQDNNLNNGKEPIEWTILEINENERYVILFANQVLDKMKYTNIAEENNYKDGYKNSTIRNFLINDFYNIAFTERDKRYIKARKDVSEDGSEDTVWLLSEREFSNYYNGNNNLAVLQTQSGAYFRVSDYACSKGGSYSQEYYLRDYDTSHYGWYYRNDGSKYWRMAPCKFIDRNKVGRIWNTTNKGVRPGIKVDLALIANSNDIIWDLGDKATWIEGYVASTSYTSEMSNPLPESDKVFKEGYEFKYWSIDGIETDTIDEYQIGDIVVKANWEELKYNINYFDSPGATEPLKIATRSYFTSYTLDEKPSWSRPYNFKYWADRDTHEIVESTEVIQKTDKNISVYAVWDTVSNSEMNNNITWELNGGKWDNNYKKPLTYDIGQNNILPTNKNIKKDNKYLSGWKLNDEIITTIPSTMKGDIILNAEWIDSNYKINYYESKDSKTIKKTTSRAYDQKVVLDKTASWAPQFRTVGYWIDKDTNEKITEVPVNTFKDINVYPVWVKDQKKINSIKVGDTIEFGHYPQSSADYNVVEPVEWEVKWIFEEYNCKYAVLSSKKILDYSTAQWDYRGFLNKLTRKDFAWYDASSFSDYSTRGFFTTSYPGRAVKPYISQNLHISSCTQYLYDYPKLTAVKATNYVKQKAKRINFLNQITFSSYNDEIPYWAPTLYESIWNTPNCWVYDKKESNPTEYNTSEESARLAKMRKSTSYQGVRPMVMLNLDMVDGGATKSKITWDRDGGSWKDAKYTPIEEYEEGKITSLPTEKDIIKTGYKFDGWYINTDRTQAYREIPATQTGAITLTAKWTKTITQYKINWQLKGGTFKEEYKHYETDKHNDTEDFVLPTEDMLNPPYGKIFKEWLVEGVATTSIAKEIKKDVTVEVNWAKSTGSFESFNIGTYKTTIEDTEEEVDLDWLILDKKDDKLLLMTKNVIDNVSYDKNGNANFKNSSIKKWLNNDFYDKTFDDKQKRNIFNDKNNGKVFLLTKEQFNEYFATNMQSLAEATEYAGSVNNGGEKLDLRGSLSPYWLMATEGTKVPYVQNDGILNESGIEANAKTIGVRPCIWVEEKKMDEVSVFDVGKFFRSLSDNLKPFFARFFGIIW